MGYNNPFEILSLSAKKIVPLPRLKRRMIQLFKSLFSFFISDYDITPIAKIDLFSSLHFNYGLMLEIKPIFGGSEGV